MSLTVPVVRLKNEAGNILDESGNFRSHFTGFKRGDEIGRAFQVSYRFKPGP